MDRMITRKEFLKSIGFGATALFWASTGFGFPGKDNQKGKSIKGEIFVGDAEVVQGGVLL